MRVLITGNNGYIGKVMTKMMLEQGSEVVGLDTNYYYDCDFGSTKNGEDKSRQINKDIRNISISDLEGIDVVCHLAALSNDPIGRFTPESTKEINHIASVKMARLAKEVGIERFVFSSSCSVYGISETPNLTEDSELNPITEYAKSKAEAEKDISVLADDNFSPTFMRNATVYGVSPRFRIDLVVNNLVGYAFTLGKIVIKSDGTPWRPLIHVQDVCRAFIEVIKAPREIIHNQVFNVGLNEGNYQIRDIADVVGEVIPNCEIEYTYEHTDSRTYSVNFDKIHNALPSFKPEWDIHRGCVELHEAFKQYGLTYDELVGRKYVRLEQLKHLMENKEIDGKFYWK